MKLIYNISIRLYSFIALIISPFNLKAKKWINGRKNILAKIKKEFIVSNKKVIWIHVSSLGEFEQGRQIIEKIKNSYQNIKIILTFFSPSGYEIRKNYKFADNVFYLPVDTKKNAKAFINIINPEIVFFVKYDIWYNYLNELKNQKIRTYLISANFRKNQIYFKSYGKFYAKILKSFNTIFVQNENSKNLLKKIGISNSVITGDTRFDRVWEIAKLAKPNTILENFKTSDLLIVAGSTWERDEEILLNLLKAIPKIKLVIAPHLIHKQNISRIQKLFNNFNTSLYSNYSNESQVLIIDNIGLLSSIYKYADIAYIGGGFGKGIHNILEPAAHGKPVIFGPKYYKFPEAIDTIANKICFSIKNPSDLIILIEKLIADKNYLQTLSEKMSEYINKNIGSSDEILKKVKIL